jgi:predicted membrane-bound spermidine synthase
MTRALALALTLLTGFSGLVYEVAWQKYLSTLLGSHSEATAAVLAIFLGGLSLGYWLFGLVTRRFVLRSETRGAAPRLFLLYGAIEASIGVYVIAFPWLFQGVQILSFSIPHGPAGVGFAIDVLLSALLIGPASVLMGGTIPILTQALARSLADATRFHAFVYAFNTAGAFAGALAAGFYLVPVLGLVGVMLAMGMINLLAGTIFVLLGTQRLCAYSLPSYETDRRASKPGSFGVYAAVAALTGFAMMAIQTTAIRLAGLSFGSSQFTFSMVVAAFILCIALGSFLVSIPPRISKIYVVLNQWGLALLLLILYPLLEDSPYWVHVIRSLVHDQSAGFAAYYFLGFLLILFVLGLPVILSGAALPLLFHHMRREVDHLGDLAGSLYSWNTVGSLLGALLGGYILLFWFDLHHIHRMAVVALLVAALVLTIRVYRWKPVVIAVMIPLVGILTLLPGWDPNRLYVGLFRSREPLAGTYEGPDSFAKFHPEYYQTKIIFHVDDPVVSVTAVEYPAPRGKKSLSIATNGKPDGNTHGDYTTMALVAILPALMAKESERAFVIGWGTGISAGELASLDSIRSVDVAEISTGVIAAAPLFDFANLRASRNEKIRVIRGDAYRALMRSTRKYDVIVSEPSNPWVTGVEMLYSREFLEAARERLSPGGVHCQWFHLYETDDATVAMVLQTYAEVFDHVAIWVAKDPDFLLLGFDEPDSAMDVYRLEERSRRPDFKASLQRAGIGSFPALLAHEFVPLGVLHAIELEGPIQTLYHPRLNDIAGRAFFHGVRGELPFMGSRKIARTAAESSMLQNYALELGGRLPGEQRAELIRHVCYAVGPRCKALVAQWISEGIDSQLLHDTRSFVVNGLAPVEAAAGLPITDEESLEALAELFPGRDGHREISDFVTIAAAEQATEDFVRLYHHGAPFDGEQLLDIWSRCREGRRSEAECKRANGRQALFLSESELEKRVHQCAAAGSFGPMCQRGFDQARALLEGQ